MEFDQLRTFLAVVEHESFSRAAEALHLSQPTVSFHIRAIEEKLGVRVLDRGARKVRVTQAGRILRGYAERLLALRREAEQRVRAGEGLETGELRIAASTVPGEYLLPQVLAKFRQAHPGVRVSVEVADSEVAVDAVRGDRAEVAAVGTRPRDRRLDCTPMGQDEIVLVAAPGFGPTKLEPARLAQLPIVIREAGSGTRQAVAELLSRRHLHLTDLKIALELGSTEAVKRAVRAGVGYAFLSRLAVAEDLAARKLVEVHCNGLPIVRKLFWVRRRDASLSPAARRLIEMVSGAAKTEVC